ncbi:transcriptional regulator, partial [Paenibacillus dendritiformis]|nr:transcriptional regulator [Paenibacillus dendritiformis]
MQFPVDRPEELGRVVRAVRRAQRIRQDDLA